MKWLLVVLAVIALVGWALFAFVYEKFGLTTSGDLLGVPRTPVSPQATPPTTITPPQNSTFTPDVFRGPSAAPRIIGPSGPPPNY